MTKKFNRHFNRYLTESMDLDLNDRIISILPAEKKISICAWCDKDKSVTNHWLSKGFRTSHGVCKACEARMDAQLGG